MDQHARRGLTKREFDEFVDTIMDQEGISRKQARKRAQEIVDGKDEKKPDVSPSHPFFPTFGQGF